jgi:2-aminoadipate transaminase
MLAAEFYREPGSLAHHLALMTQNLQRKRDIMLDGLGAHLKGEASWNRPDGGKYIWARFRDGIDTDRLASEAAEAGVMVLPGSLFSARPDPPRSHLRLCFSLETEERIRKGVSILADVLARARG